VGFALTDQGKLIWDRIKREYEMSFMDRAKDFADDHDEQVDQGIEKAGDLIDDRTGNRYSEQIDKGTDQAQERSGAGDTQQ
jgi:hypothetical protein